MYACSRAADAAARPQAQASTDRRRGDVARFGSSLGTRVHLERATHKLFWLFKNYGLVGLAGLSFFTSTHVVSPTMAPAPNPIANGEFMIPPPAAGAAPAARLLFFFLPLLAVPEDSSRVVS